MELKIDKDLEGLFPPLSDEELSLLEENILKEGCLEKLTVWNGTIVDGHNRYKICKKHNLPFEIREKEFSNKDEAIVWMIDNQKGRRNMSIPAKIEMALKREGSIRAMAKKNQEGFKGNQYTSGVLAHGPKDQKPINTLKELADFAGTSPKTVQRFKKVKDSGDEELYKEVMLGPEKGGKSIRAGYDEVMKKAREVEQKEQGVKTCTLCNIEKPLSDFRKGGSTCKTCMSSIESMGMSVTEYREKYDTSELARIAEIHDKMKTPPPESGSGNNSLSDDPIITEMTETIKSFRNAMNKFLFIEEKTDKALKDLINETIEELTEINANIKEY